MACADQESFLRGGPTLTTFYLLIYLFLRGEDDPSKYHNKRAIVGEPIMAQN